MTRYLQASMAVAVGAACAGVAVPQLCGASLRPEQAAPVTIVADGREGQAWTKWGDPGDELVSLRADEQVAMDGKHSLRVQVTLTPEANWWPALGLELPEDLDAAAHSLLELHLYLPPDAPAPPDELVQAALYQGDKLVTAATLLEVKPGQWNRLVIGLRGLAKGQQGAPRLKLAWRPPAVKQNTTYVFYVDAVRAVAAADGHGEITELKDLCITTPLAAGGEPRAAIVAPADDRYHEAVRTVQEAVRGAAGCELPVIGDDAGESEELLADRALIALGNMNTSRFIETLYRHWYCFTDLRYPGAGGWELRSLHDPYGTGHNVILLGGSDGEGVAQAARQFVADLGPADPLSVGWLMEIKLGEGLTPPEIGETVYGWRDSFRLDARGNTVGYGPTTYFGWNPISIQAALYYMTGEEKYLREFVRLALPDPDNVPTEIRTSDAIYDVKHPLVENYHYRVHLVDCIWDLIEESPLLGDRKRSPDEVRLAITNELLAHQDFIDAEDDWCPPRGASRHGLYDALCIYTGSRYFAKYYPAARWQQRLDNMRRFFSWWLENPTWGELDTLGWVNTSTEPVLEYFLMADPDSFVESGLARTMMGALEMLWTGQAQEESNRCQTISLMHKAAYLLKDGRYIYMARQAGYDFNAFRIGQSWWPGPELKVEPPLDRVNRISLMPLAQPLAERVQAPFEPERGYQFLSYRTGVGPDDGYFFLDGFNGGGRNPHHVSALKLLRNTGHLLLSGYGNQVVILRDGMVENHVAKAARLDAAVALDGLAYTRTTVPDAGYSQWQRDILWVGDEYTLVADTVNAREPGTFEVICQWEPLGDAKLSEEVANAAQRPNRTTITCAQPVSLSVVGAQLRQTLKAQIDASQARTVVNAIYADSATGAFDYRLAPVGENAALVSGKDEALLTVGQFATEGLELYADASHLREDRICLFAAGHGLRLSGERVFVESTAPMSLVWRLATGRIAVECSQEGSLVLALAETAALQLDGHDVAASGGEGLVGVQLEPGGHVITGAQPRGDVSETLGRTIAGLAQPAAPAPPALATEPAPVWYGWENDQLPGGITHVGVAPVIDDVPRIWVATEQPAIVLINAAGSADRTIEMPAKVNALHVAAWPQGDERVMAVAGCDDDHLRAFSPAGDFLWEAESSVSETFKVGDRYQAPWFTDPEVKRGVLSLMIADVSGTEQPEIVLGRPSTVEYWSTDGELIERLPIQWGDCTELALLAHTEGPRVLIGKLFTGIDGISMLDAGRKLLGNSAYLGLPAGSTRMSQWMQRGVVGLKAADLDGDGAQEVVVARSGHWNDVRVYDQAGTCLWQRSFGPARPRSDFLRDLVVADVAGDESADVACGMANGWVCCFDADGAVLWTRRFPSPVTRLAAAAGHLVVGLESGRVVRVNEAGDTVKAAELGSPITALTTTEGRWLWMSEPVIVAGTKSGKLAGLHW